MKAREVFLAFFEDYPFEDFSPEAEMTSELWERFNKELKEEVHSYLYSHKLFSYSEDEIVEGISDKAHDKDFWEIGDYISQIYEPEYLVECAEENAYRHSVSVESRYW